MLISCAAGLFTNLELHSICVFSEVGNSIRSFNGVYIKSVFGWQLFSHHLDVNSVAVIVCYCCRTIVVLSEWSVEYRLHHVWTVHRSYFVWGVYGAFLMNLTGSMLCILLKLMLFLLINVPHIEEGASLKSLVTTTRKISCTNGCWCWFSAIMWSPMLAHLSTQPRERILAVPADQFLTVVFSPSGSVLIEGKKNNYAGI